MPAITRDVKYEFPGRSPRVGKHVHNQKLQVDDMLRIDIGQVLPPTLQHASWPDSFQKDKQERGVLANSFSTCTAQES